jgi:hypothetical protein
VICKLENEGNAVMTKARTLALSYMYELFKKEIFVDVKPVVTEFVGKCELSVWISVGLWPSEGVAICDNGIEAYVVSDEIQSVEKFLLDAKPDITNVESMRTILEWIIPAPLRLLSDETPDSIKDSTGYREGPRLLENALFFYCNDSVKGAVIRFKIDSNYVIKGESVGEGFIWYKA